MHTFAGLFLQRCGRAARPLLLPLIAALLIAASACREPERTLPVPQTDSTNTLTKNLVAVMEETDGLDSFLVALERSELRKDIAHTGPYTVFAPTNAAFEQVPARVDTLYLSASPDSLRALMNFHRAHGRYPPSEVTDSLRISTIVGLPVTLKRTGSDSTLQVNGHSIQRSVEARNGLLYVIPSLLSPPLPDTTQQGPGF